MLSEINTIQFGILSDDDIKNLSGCILINKTNLAAEEGTVYDPKLGSVDSNIKCETCHETALKCIGHFGRIELNIPIILFYKQCVTMLKCFCFECHRILVSKDELELNNIRGYDKIIEYISKISTCFHCNTPHPEIRYTSAENTITSQHKFRNLKTSRVLEPIFIKQIFDHIPKEDVQLLGVNVDMFHPKNLVLTKFPVIPIACRPKSVVPENTSDDDLTIILIDIIKNNLILEKEENKEKREKAIAAIKFKTLTYCDNTKGKATHTTNHRPMSGIKERIARKNGIVRKNLMGKRCNQTARTVIGPDPTLKINEVGIPYEIANNLTISEYVTKFNIAKLTKLVNENKACTINRKSGIKTDIASGSIKAGTHLFHGDEIIRNNESLIVTDCKMKLLITDILKRNGKKINIELSKKKDLELNIGDKIDRYLQNGDIILINRQPTLHKNSMQAMEIVKKHGKTIRLNLANTKQFNADFDSS